MSFQFSQTSLFVKTLFFVKRSFQVIFHTQKLNIMTPTQLVRQCLTFLIFQVKKPNIDQICPTKTFSIPIFQVSTHFIKEFCSIFRFLFASLFIFYDMPADFSISFDEDCIYLLICSFSGSIKEFSNGGDKIWVLIWLFCFEHLRKLKKINSDWIIQFGVDYFKCWFVNYRLSKIIYLMYVLLIYGNLMQQKFSLHT